MSRRKSPKRKSSKRNQNFDFGSSILPKILEYNYLSDVVKNLEKKHKRSNILNTSATYFKNKVFYVSRVRPLEQDNPCAIVECEEKLFVNSGLSEKVKYKRREQEKCQPHWGGEGYHEDIILYVKDEKGNFSIPSYDDEFKNDLEQVLGDTRITHNNEYLLLYDRNLGNFLLFDYDEDKNKIINVGSLTIEGSDSANMSIIDFELKEEYLYVKYVLGFVKYRLYIAQTKITDSMKFMDSIEIKTNDYMLYMGSDIFLLFQLELLMFS